MSASILHDTVDRETGFFSAGDELSGDPPITWGRGFILTAALAAAYAIQGFICHIWTSTSGGLAAIWLGNGILAAGLLILPRRYGLLLAALCAVLSAWITYGVSHTPLGESLLIVATGLIQSVLAAVIIRRVGRAGLDPTRLRRVVPMLALGVVPATVLTATVGWLITSAMGTAPKPYLWPIWVTGDMMGMMLSLPATLILARPSRFHIRETFTDWKELAVLLLVVGIAAAIFFLPGPRGTSVLMVIAAFLAAFRLRPPSIAVMNIAIVAITTTSMLNGFGSTRWPGSPDAQFLLLQLMILPVTLCTLLTSAIVSDRVRQERHLRRALDAAKSARNKAVAADGVKARFLASISHEMRTPLNSIMGHAELLDRLSAVSVGEARRVQAIRSSSETLSQLIDDVLDFTQIDAGRIEIRRTELDLTALCREALQGAQVLADGKPLEFHLDMAANVTPARLGDARRLQQVLRQLLSNAVKFTPIGKVTLEVRAEIVAGQPHILFAVRDTGVGIDAAELGRMFQPFSQADETSKRRFGGAGLGLAIARGIVDAMGGEAGAESRFGDGSRFWFRVPLEIAEPGLSAPTVVCLPAADAPARALVVDDHPVNRDLAATFMRALGFDVVCAEDGRQALDAMTAGWFDIVLMDLHMPVMDGLEATRAIRRLPGARGHTPIVALTASASDEAIGDCMDAGMNGHLAKPIRGEALAVALQTALAA